MTSPLICDGALILYGDVGVANWADVEGFTSNDVVAALAELGSGADVVVRINSGGGNAFEGAAIHAILSAHLGKITTVVEGIAASAASIIAMAGTERIIASGSMMMVHDPAGLTIGSADDHDDTAAMLRKLAGSMASIYAAATGRPARDHMAEMAAETWLSAIEAVAGRYATRIGTAPTSATACAPFPFRAYAKAPPDLVALADAKGWSSRAFTASHVAGRTPAQGERGRHRPAVDPEREIRETCAIAGKPDRAAAYIAAGTPPAEVLRQLLAETAPTTAVPPVDLVADMKRRHGVADGTDAPSAGLAASRASMERTLRSQGLVAAGAPPRGVNVLAAGNTSMQRELQRAGLVARSRS
ncbi:ATP-dependent Clp protease proteolytic subunit [Methylobacterium sp. E-016]|uniref:head maturation protease, ClpP-related n=1 Tax=Methylobacterium sp. E-016 TaxID=2836556 RepID=UPI001FB9A8FE|nr:head maturation protease, ClpP-related [Methylobacterium sp. E-016]MCJ2077890.1 ATP-dependent Clp protease proteolytic subunit [Methylobacterium sp. E-016]